jgi:bacterioferritin (cytochrome b1)
MGHVLNRWITRPMVPFPEELTAAEKKDFRQFLFQAKGEDQADDLIDIQAMRMYEGWGARMLFQRTIEITLPRMHRALSLIEGIQGAAADEARRKQWELIGKRLQAVIYLLQSADNMVEYQAQLDRVKSLGGKPEANPVLGVQSGWDRTDLMATARKEIDTMVNLNRLLESTTEPILDMAPTPGEETIMRLGPNLTNHIKHKINVMSAHWRDYDRLFTVPNP